MAIFPQTDHAYSATTGQARAKRGLPPLLLPGTRAEMLHNLPNALKPVLAAMSDPASLQAAQAQQLARRGKRQERARCECSAAPLMLQCQSQHRKRSRAAH